MRGWVRGETRTHTQQLIQSYVHMQTTWNTIYSELTCLCVKCNPHTSYWPVIVLQFYSVANTVHFELHWRNDHAPHCQLPHDNREEGIGKNVCMHRHSIKTYTYTGMCSYLRWCFSASYWMNLHYQLPLVPPLEEELITGVEMVLLLVQSDVNCASLREEVEKKR